MKLLRKILTGVSFAFLLAFLISEITGIDLWFHLKLGKLIVEKIHIPETNLFSYTSTDYQWVDSQWLFQVTVYLVYLVSGFCGLGVLEIVVVFAAALVIFYGFGYKKENYVVSCAGLLLLVLTAGERFTVRPEIFTFLFIAVYLKILYDYTKGGRDRIGLLPVLQIIWVNLHGLFPLGVMIIFSFLTGEFFHGLWLRKKMEPHGPKAPVVPTFMSFGATSRCLPIHPRASRAYAHGFLEIGTEHNGYRAVTGKKYRKLLLMAVITLACCILNPNFLKGLLFPLILLQEISPGSSEFMKSVFEFKPQVSSAFAVLALLSFLSFIIARKKISLSYVFIGVSFLLLALMARRNLALFAFAIVPVTVHNFNSVDYKTLKERFNENVIGVFKHIIPMLLIFYCIITTFRVVTGSYYVEKGMFNKFGLGVSGHAFSEGAVKFIKDNKLSGNMFNDNYSGGHLIWALYPERKVFIDGRWEAYPPQFLNYYRAVISEPDLWDDMILRFKVAYVFINHNSAEAAVIIPRLAGDDRWLLSYIDSGASVYVRNTPGEPGSFCKIDAGKVVLTGNPKENKGILSVEHPYGYYNAGNAFYFMNLLERSETEFRKALNACPRFNPARYMLGVVLRRQSRFSEAEAEFGKILLKKPRDAGVLQEMSVVRIAQKKYDEAEEGLLKLMKLSPDYFTVFLAASLYYERNQYIKSEEYFLKALKLNPEFSPAYTGYANLLVMLKRFKQAEELYLKTLDIPPDYDVEYCDLGSFYLKTYDFKKTEESFLKALRINPGCTQAVKALELIKREKAGSHSGKN